jgi:hypothetical protein
VTGLSLSRALRDFPDVVLEKVEYLANLGRAREAGVGGIPALVSGDKRLSGIILGKKRIHQFLESL